MIQSISQRGVSLASAPRATPRAGRLTIVAFSSPCGAGKDFEAFDAAKGRWRSRELDFSSFQDQNASLQGARAETHSYRRREKFDANGVAGIGRRREPNRHRYEFFRMARREILERSPAREAERVQSMRNRAFEAGVSCNVGVGVNRHVVAARLPVEQRRLRRSSIVDHRRRFVDRSHRSRQGRRCAEAARAALVPQELCRLQAGQRFAVLCLYEILRGVKNRSPRRTLVVDGPQAKFKPRGRATRPMRQEPAALASPSRGPGNGILRAETGGRIQAQNAGEQSEFGSQTTLRLTNPPELRGFLSTRKPPRFAGTAWWRTQSRQTGLRDRVRLGNREKHTAMAVNAFFWGPKRRGLRFSERLNTRPYNVLAEHEPNRAKQNKRQNKRQSNRQTANDSQRFFSAFERLNARLYNALASVAG